MFVQRSRMDEVWERPGFSQSSSSSGVMPLEGLEEGASGISVRSGFPHDSGGFVAPLQHRGTPSGLTGVVTVGGQLGSSRRLFGGRAREEPREPPAASIMTRPPPGHQVCMRTLLFGGRLLSSHWLLPVISSVAHTTRLHPARTSIFCTTRRAVDGERGGAGSRGLARGEGGQKG
jgi:hypothetical protein